MGELQLSYISCTKLGSMIPRIGFHCTFTTEHKTTLDFVSFLLFYNSCLRPRPFLLLFVQGEEWHIGYFDNLESYTRNISNSMTFTTKSSNKNLVVLLEMQDRNLFMVWRLNSEMIAMWWNRFKGLHRIAGHSRDVPIEIHEINSILTHDMLTSMKFRQPSRGTKAVIFFPFLISCTRTHFLIAELGCLASTPLDKTSTLSSYQGKTLNRG